MASEQLTAPAPDGGWSGEIVTCAGALVVPPVTSRFRQEAGVFDGSGRYCQHAATWRNDRKMTIEPAEVPAARSEVSGRWLWAGLLFDHFGHFLVESVSRLWGLEHLDQQVDGICYIPKRHRRPAELHRFQADVFDAFGIGMSVQVVRAPTRFEHLVVPGQAFGLGRMISGTAKMRDAFHRRFGASISAKGPERLYVSRSGLPTQQGGILGETALEQYLVAEGYEIFHPEAHPIATQIARYKAARQVIIADGSAGHLYAYVGRADQKVAYIPRRTFWADGPIDHISHFTGSEVLVPDSIRREWLPHDQKAYRGVAFVVHDFAALQSALAGAGFVGAGPEWTTITNDAALAAIRQMGLTDAFAASS
jgi:hypothetical protein